MLLTSPPFWNSAQPAFTCSKLIIQTQDQGVKYVQIKNKVTRMASFHNIIRWPAGIYLPMASFWCLYCLLWTYFTPCSRVSIVNCEHVIADWVNLWSFFKDIFRNWKQDVEAYLEPCQTSKKEQHIAKKICTFNRLTILTGNFPKLHLWCLTEF